MPNPDFTLSQLALDAEGKLTDLIDQLDTHPTLSGLPDLLIVDLRDRVKGVRKYLAVMALSGTETPPDKTPVQQPITAGELRERLANWPPNAIVCVSLPDDHPEDRLVISKNLSAWGDGEQPLRYLDLMPVQS